MLDHAAKATFRTRGIHLPIFGISILAASPRILPLQWTGAMAIYIFLCQLWLHQAIPKTSQRSEVFGFGHLEGSRLQGELLRVVEGSL